LLEFYGQILAGVGRQLLKLQQHTAHHGDKRQPGEQADAYRDPNGGVVTITVVVACIVVSAIVISKKALAATTTSVSNDG
jgi:hypothetical protein